MNKIVRTILLAVCLSLILTTHTFAGGPPFLTDDPEPVDYQHGEAYLFTLGEHFRGGYAIEGPAGELNYGVLPDTQLHLIVPMSTVGGGAAPTVSGLGDTEIGIKYRFVHVHGMDLAKSRAQALGRTNFAAVYAPLPGNLTVRQNLRVFGLLYGVRDLSERINALIREFDLEKFRNVKCGVLSSGEQTRVALAKAMLNQPHLLLLDEPTASLDPVAAREIRARIRQFAVSGDGGVLWTTHNMVEVQDVCDRVLFLSHGRIMLEGDPKTLPDEHGQPTLEELFIAVAREPLTLERT